MNLQITVPYETCPFSCPFCIANNPKVQSIFKNVYEENFKEYMDNLIFTIRLYDIKTVIITGDTEPTLNMRWVTQVVWNIKQEFGSLVKIEIQTRNYNLYTISQLSYLDIDVIAFSFHETKKLNELGNLFLPQTKRAVIVLNSLFDTEQADYSGYEQVTFKSIQKGENLEINQWIDSHEFVSDVKYGIENYSNISFMFDKNCMDSENRYFIFREDSQVYKTWTDTIPME